MALIVGVEEAGRGPVIGPMVMAAVAIEEEDHQKLKEIGAKDSKLLSPRQRELIYDRIATTAKQYEIIILQPEEIDAALNKEGDNLNLLEVRTAAELINKLKPRKAILDCPSNNIPQFIKDVRYHLLDKSTELVAEHQADKNHPVVSAASIIAKVTRDLEIEKLKQKIQKDFGSGYPSDPKTRGFLEKFWDTYPEIFRKTWETYKKIVRAKSQKGLGEF